MTIIKAQQKELQDVRNELLESLDEDREKLKDLSLHQLAVKASNGIYWREKELQEAKDVIKKQDAFLYKIENVYIPEIAELEARLERLKEALEHIVDLHICDPSFNSIEEQSELEHKRFHIAQEALASLPEEGGKE